MKLPLSWLNEYVDIGNISIMELSHKLVNIGFEVEDVTYLGVEKVVSGKIEKITPHPDAQKLVICELNVALDKPLQIVTGASNVFEGAIVPVALDGASLSGGKKITTGNLRGVLSEGMLCSGGELGITDAFYKGADVDGIMILEPETKIGADINNVLGLDEYIFDISITANRPDCQSVYGMAREIAAFLDRPLKPLKLDYKIKETSKYIDIKICSKDCSRFTGRIIENVKIAESPAWLKKRLVMCGHKPINNIVDITNYVLLEVGQPLHAFDIDFIDTEINVRKAMSNEKIKLLDGKEYSLSDKNLVIADKTKPLSIAGVMGGEYSGINDATSCVFLESARFARGSIRATSRFLGLRSDSSARFEKGVDFLSIDNGRERALALIYELKAGIITSYSLNKGENSKKCKVIKTSLEQVCGVLGIKIGFDEAIKILQALEIKCSGNEKKLLCEIPLFRDDIDNFTDIAEELIRFYGYDKIESTTFKSSETIEGGLSFKQKQIEKIKNILTGFGCMEIITYSFINSAQYDKLAIANNDTLRNTISLINPLSEEYNIMRTQLTGSMLNTIHLNTSRKNKNFRLFEVSKVFIPKSLPINELPYENETLCIGFLGENESFYSLKSVISQILTSFKVNYTIEYSKKSYLHTGISADIISDGSVVGSFGKIHPTVAKNFDVPSDCFIAELDLEGIISRSLPNVIYSELPKYPLVERDLAVVVDDGIMVGDLVALIKQNSDNLCESVELFDVYKGEQIEKGHKSVALSIKLRSREHTLNDSEIQAIMKKIIDALATTGAKLRI